MAVEDGKITWQDVATMPPVETPPSPWSKRGERGKRGKRGEAKPDLDSPLLLWRVEMPVPDDLEGVPPHYMLVELNERFRPPFDTVLAMHAFYLDDLLTVHLHLGGRHVQTIVLDVSDYGKWRVLYAGEPE